MKYFATDNSNGTDKCSDVVVIVSSVDSSSHLGLKR